MTPAPTFAFGPYLFIPSRQLLLNDGQAVRVGGRALDLLAAFVSRPGELLSKRELLEEAWPSTTVVEGNLKVHIAALRRALDDDVDSASYIVTVNGRGYRFIAPVETGQAVAALTSGEKGQLASVEPAGGHGEDTTALLAKAMRLLLIDLPNGSGSEFVTPARRRVLFIELTERDEAWIEDLFAQRLRAISATQ